MSDEEINSTDGTPPQRLRRPLSPPAQSAPHGGEPPVPDAERQARIEAARARMRRVPVRRPVQSEGAPDTAAGTLRPSEREHEPPASEPASAQIDALLAVEPDADQLPPPVPQTPARRGVRLPMPPEPAPPRLDETDDSNPIMAAFEARLQDAEAEAAPEPELPPEPPIAREEPEPEPVLPSWRTPVSRYAPGDDPAEWQSDDEPEDDDLPEEDISGLLGRASDDLEVDPTEEQFEPFIPPAGVYTRSGFGALRRAEAETPPPPAPVREPDPFEDDETYADDEYVPDDDEWLELLSDEAIVEEQAAADFEAQRATAARQKRRRMRTAVRDVVEMILLGLLVFLVVKASVHRYRVEGDSMFPTVHDGQQFLVNKLSYAEVDVESIPFIEPGDDPTRDVFGAPSRGDVIVFHDPRGTNQDLIKRVIGLPGDTVSVQDGIVYINGFELIEDYIVDPTRRNTEPVTVPPDQYFVMGDNRNNSTDSRVIGPVPRELIVGRAVASVWPRSDIGFAPNEDPKCAVVPSCQPEDAAAASADQ